MDMGLNQHLATPALETEADIFGEYSLQLPYDRLKTSQTAYLQARVSFALHTGRNGVPGNFVTESPQEWASFLSAACAALFYRYSGQARFPLYLRCFPASAATAAGGLNPVNLPLTPRVSGSLVFRELAQTLLHTYTPLVGSLPGAADMPVLITFKMLPKNGPLPEQWLGEAQYLPLLTSAEVDLHLVFVLGGETLQVLFVYNSYLFDADTIERLAQHLRALMLSAAHNPAARLADLTLFDNSEYQWLYDNGRGRPRGFTATPVHLDIERHAERQPQALALSFNRQSLTYLELNRRANRLANYLLSRGLGTESRVVVCIEPCLDIAVVLLAIFKAGATYVPLNPDYPAHRIHTILEDTDPAVVITHSHLNVLPEACGLTVIDLDRQWGSIDTYAADNPRVAIDIGQTAYIYYTSGTTGKPKGVMASYGNLINYIRVAAEKYGFNNRDVMPAVASFTFSISMFELMSPLVAGGRLVVLERKQVLDPEAMVQTLQAITVLHAGPSLLKKLVRYIRENITDCSVFAGLRHLSSGGDMIPPELLRELRKLFSGAELFVIYGCSEISCMGCTYEVEPDKPVVKTYVGKPFSNVTLALLDADGNRVPVGVTGDVCFGGKGVVKGYLNRPELTAEKFFVHEGERFYRTGDRGRLNSEGHLELLGRSDFQVQLRGMRVELGEIEYHLRQAPGVRDGLAMAQGRGDDADNMLVAYFVPNGVHPVSVDTLREHMRRYLPDYMVPSFYMELEALPLNHNMKVDRKALPDLEAARAAALARSLAEGACATAPGREPRTPMERKLAALWSDLLGRGGIGLDDNFLEIGGDSLLGMELIVKAKQRLGVKLDGMDILRESLQVLAGICGRQLNETGDGESGGDRRVRTIDPVESFFFGPDESLYGIFHSAQSVGRTGAPVLICAPIGNDYIRCYFFLKNLADLLAARGIAVLRFDYRCTGDALGEDLQASIGGWRGDLLEAHRELTRRTGSARVSVLGVRLGATLAIEALGQSDIERWVLWDPVLDGRAHYQALAGMHREKVQRMRIIRNLKKPKPIRGGEELAGFTYSRAVLEELKALKLEAGLLKPGAWLGQLYSGRTDEPRNSFAQGRVEYVEQHLDWYHPGSMTKAITDNRITQKLIDLLLEGGQ